MKTPSNKGGATEGPSASELWALYGVLIQGAALWNQARFWDAHEVWEQGWRSVDGPWRDLFQGLILAAAALYKRTQPGGTPRVCVRLLTKAEARLKPLLDPEPLLPELEPLLASLCEIRAQAQTYLENPTPSHWAQALNPAPLLGFAAPQQNPDMSPR